MTEETRCDIGGQSNMSKHMTTLEEINDKISKAQTTVRELENERAVVEAIHAAVNGYRQSLHDAAVNGHEFCNGEPHPDDERQWEGRAEFVTDMLNKAIREAVQFDHFGKWNTDSSGYLYQVVKREPSRTADDALRVRVPVGMDTAEALARLREIAEWIEAEGIPAIGESELLERLTKEWMHKTMKGADADNNSHPF